MADLPSMDDILKTGRARQRRLELGLGALILASGLVLKLTVSTPELRFPTFGAIGIGAAMIGRGLSGRS
jgi:hypothetical protein